MAKKSPEDKNTPRQPLSQRPGAAAAGVGGGPTQGLPDRASAPSTLVPAPNGLGALGYAAEVSAHLHDQLGNQIVLDTLRGPDEVGLAGFVALELSSAVAGLQGDQAALSSNEALLRHLGSASQETMTAAEALRVARASAGAPLPEGLRQRLEGALGRDLSHVRVHVGGAADRAARGVNALAFTVGRDLYFRADAWAPGTEEGDRVLLHELTHVAQDDDGRVSAPQAGADLSRPNDPLEREASHAEAPGLIALAEIDDAAGGWDEGVGYLHAPLTTGHDPGGEAPSAAALLPQRDPLHLLPTQPQDLLERVRRVGSLPPAVRQQLERALGEPSEALRAGGEALERLMGVGEALLGEPVEQLDPLQAALKGVFSQPESRPQADGAPQKSPLDAVVGALLTPHSTEDGGDSVPQDTPASVASNNPELVGGAETEGGGPKLAPVAEQLVQGGRRLRGELQGLTRGVMKGLGVPSGAEEELRAGLEPLLSGLIGSMERAAGRFGAQMSESGDGGKARGEQSQPSASALHEPAPGQALVANGPQGAPAAGLPTQISAQTTPGEAAAPSPLVAFTERLRGFPQRLVEGLGGRERGGGSLQSILSIPLSDEASAPGETLLGGLLDLTRRAFAPQEEATPVVDAAPSPEVKPVVEAPHAEAAPEGAAPNPEGPVEDAVLQQEAGAVEDAAPQQEEIVTPNAALQQSEPAPPTAVQGPEATPAPAEEAAPSPTPAVATGTNVVAEAVTPEAPLVEPAVEAPAVEAAPAAPLTQAPAPTNVGPTPTAPPSPVPYDAAAQAQRLGAESARRLRDLAELARVEEVAAQQETGGAAEAEADPTQNLIEDPLAALKGREPVTDQLLGALTGDSGVASQVVKDVQQSVMASIADAPRAEPQSTTPVEPMSPETALAGLGDRLSSVLDELPNVMGDPFAALADRSVGGKVKAEAGDMAAVGREAFLRHVGGGLGFGRFDALIRDELVKSSPPARADEPVAPASAPAASGPSFSGAQLLNRLGATPSGGGGAPPTKQAKEAQEEAPAAAPSTLPPAAELEGAAKSSEAGLAGIGATLNTMVGLVSDGAMLQASLGESELLGATNKLREQLLGAASAAPPLVAPVMPDLAAGFTAEASPKLNFGAEEAGIKAELPDAGSILPQGGLGGEGLTKLLSLEGVKIAPIVSAAAPVALQAPAVDMAPKAELDAVVAQSFSEAEGKVSAGIEALSNNSAESAVVMEAEVAQNATELAATATALSAATDEVVATNIAELAQSHTEGVSAATARNADSAAAVMGLSAKGAAQGDKLAQEAGKRASAPPNTDRPKVDAEAFAADPAGANAQLGRDVAAERRGAESHLAEVTAQDPEQALTGEAREAVLREAKGVPEEKLAQAHAQEGEATLKEVAEEEPEVVAAEHDEEPVATADDAEAVEEGAAEETTQTEAGAEEAAVAKETTGEEPSEETGEVTAAEEEAPAAAEDAASQAPAEEEVTATARAAAEAAVETAPETMRSVLSPAPAAPIPSPNFGAMLAGAGLGVALGEDGFDLLGALDLSLGATTTPMALGLDGLPAAISALGPMLDEKAVAGLAAQLDPTAAVNAAQEAGKAKLAAAAAQIPAAADAAAAESSAALQQSLSQQSAAAESQAAASAGAQHAAVDSGAAAQSDQIGAQLSQAEAAEQARVAAEQQLVSELLATREASIEAQRPPIVSQITTVGQAQTQAREQEGQVQELASEVTKEGLLQQVETLKTAQVAVLEQTATQAKTELAAEVTQRKAELKQQAEQLKQQIEEKFKTEVQNLDKAVTEGTTRLQTQKAENDAKVKAETQTKIQQRRVEGARAAREAMNNIIQLGRAQQEASYARAEEHRQSEYAKADAVLAEAQARFAQIMAEANAQAASSNPLERFAANAIFGRANGVLADGEAKAAGIRANGDSTCASMKAEADAQMVVEVGNANKQFDAMMQQTEMAVQQLQASEQHALQANEQLLKAGLDQLKQEREMAFQRADQQRRYAIIGVDSDVAIGEMKLEEEKARAEQEIQTTLDAAKTALEAQCSALKEQIQSAHQSNLQQIQAQVNTAKSEIQAAVQEAQAQVQQQVVTARQEMRVIADERVQSMVQESAQRILRFQTEARTGVARVQQAAQTYHGHIQNAFNNQILPGLKQQQAEVVQLHQQNMAEMKAGAIAGAEARNRYYAGQINDQALKSASWSNNQIEQFRAGADGDLGRVAQLNLNMAGEHYTNFQDQMGKRVFENNTIYRDYRSDLYEKGTQLADMLAQEGAAQAWEKGGPAGVAVGFLFLGVNAVAQGGRHHLEKQMIRNAVDIGGPGLLGVPMRVDKNGNAVPDILTLKDDQILRQFGFRNYLMAGPNGPEEGLRLPNGEVVSRASLSQNPRAATAALGAMSTRFTQDGGPLISQQENIQDTLVYTGTKFLSDTVQAGKSYVENRLSSSGAFKGLTQDPGAMVAYAVGKGALWSAIDQGSDSLTSWMRGEGDLGALTQRNFTERFFEGWAAETVGEISGGIMEKMMGSAGRKLSRVIPADVQNRIAGSATNVVMRQAIGQLGEVIDRVPFARPLIRESMDFLGSLPEEVFSESLSNFSSNLVTGVRTGELQKAFEEYQRTGDASALLRQRDALLKGVFDGEALESAVTESLNEKVTGRLGDRMGSRRDAQMTQRDNDRLQAAVQSGNPQEINRLIDQINRSTDARVDNLNDQLPRLLQSAPPQVQDAVRQRLQADNQRVTDQRAAIDAREERNAQNPLRLSRSTVGTDADNTARVQSRNDVDQLVQATQRSDSAALSGLVDLVQQGSPRRAETIARNLPELLQNASPEVQAQVRERVQREAEAASALLAQRAQGYRVEVDVAAAQRVIVLSEALNPGEPAAPSPASAANPAVATPSPEATPSPDATQTAAAPTAPEVTTTPDTPDPAQDLDAAAAVVQAFETALPNEIAAVVRGLYDNGAGLDAVVAQMDALVSSASPEAKAAMGRQLMADGHAWQANPDGYDKDVVARMMTLGRAYADATARLGQDPYGKQIERTLSVITEDYSAFKERLQVYQANLGAWTDMDLPYTMWTYFGNIARYEGTEVNVFAPDDGVRAVAPTYNPETGEIGFAQNDDGSLRQSVTVKEIESANTLVIFGIDPSSGEITIQDGVQLNLGMNKALSMANPAPAPAPEVQAPAAQAPAEQTPAEQTTPEDGEQLSLLDAAPTRDIGFAPETDTDGRKVTVVPDDDHEQTTNKPDLSVTPPEETEPVVFPSVAQENVAAAPPDSPLFQQLRGIVASMLYDVPEAAPAIAETMGLSPEGLQILRDNDNVTNWAELTAAGLSDADRAALQHAAALKLVSTLDPDQPASLFLSWFDWHIGTQADFTITQPHLQNAINMDNAGMDEVAAVMGVANFKRLVLSTHGLPGGQIMKTEEGSGFNVYDARIMAEIAERAGVSSVLLAHCYGALGADGVNTLDVDSRQASGSSIAEFSSRGMDVSAYEGAVNTRTATQMVGVWSELIAAGLPDEAALQLAGAFANATGGENLNSINWSQYVSHARAELGPEGDPQAWANRNGFVDTQIRGRRVGPEQILQLLIQYGDVLLATQGVQDAPKAWQGKIPENQVDLLARMTVNDLIHGGLYPQAGITGADAQMIVRLLEEAWRGAPLVQNGELPDWAVLGSRLYFALEGQVAAIQHMDPAERAQRANVLQNLQIMRDEVWIRLAAAGQGIIDDQGQLAFLPPTDLTHYATSDANLAQSAAPAEVDGVPVADVTQTPGDVVSVDPNAPVQALLFDLDEVGAATTRSLPTPGLVGGVTTPAAPAPQGDDSQLRQDVLVEARAYFKPMLGALLTRAATRGSGGRQDRALNGLTSAVSAQLDTFRRALTMKGLDAAWVTTDVVLDMLARDTELARALQEATPGLGIEPGQLLAVMDPAHRLATQLKAVPGDDAVADDTRLGLLRDTLHRTDGAALLTGLRGGELIAELARIKDPQKRALATEMLRSGQALALGDQNGAPRVERVTRALDGSTTREAAALATELSVLATTLDTKNPGSKENNERLAHTRARVAEALQSLRDVQSRLNDPNLSDTDRQALEAKRTELTQAATKVNAVVTRSGSLLSTLAIHDNVWFADTLLPYLRESGASPPSASVSPQPNAQSEAFWLRHKLDAAAMSARKPDDLQRRLDQMIREASDQGAEGRALLVDFARRYSREHGSFYKLLTDAFSAQSHSFESTPGKNDPAIFRAMAHAFGVETSDAFEGVNLNAGAQPITLKEEVELVRLVSQAAEKIHSSFGVMNFTKITDVLRDLQSSATVTTILQKIESDPTKRAEILQKAVRAAFKESHGDIATRLTQRALEASWMSGESPDAIVLGFKNEHLVDLHIEGLTLAPQATFKSREDRLQAYYDSHPNVAQTRLAADKRVALYTGDTMGVLEAVLKLSAEDRLKALNDPLLTAELAAKHAELWPFIRHALEGQVPPQEMLSVLLALKQAVSLGLKPGEVMKAATESLPKGDVLGLGRKILTTMGKSVGGDVLQRAQQRMQPEMQKLVESWATWQGGRLEEQDPSLKGNKDERARRQQAEALNTLADPGFQALLRDHFSAEQRASITSVMMSGSTSSNDKAQQSRLGLGVDAKNVLGIIQKAYDDGKTAALREDPAVLAQLQKLGEAERQLALQLLFDTPAAKALSVMKVQGDLSDDNAVALLGKLATLSAQERDGIRNDPALVLLLTSKLKGDHLARFQRLMQLNGRSEAQATPAGQSEQDRERDWLRLRAVEGVKALITAKDDKALVTLAAALFKAKVTDPNAQAPGFAERAEQGARVGDLSAQDRPMMAEALRSSAEYAELLKRSPTLAAAVMDAVLGQRDPTPMLYHAEAARSWMNADVDGMVKAIEGVSADELLTQFVDLDAFAPALISALSAREALAALPADASDDQRQAAEQAVSAANQAMREATFDLSASRLAELSSLSKADQQKVLDAVRARVNKLLGGEAKDELALVARALQGAIGRIAPQSALKVDETLVGEVSNADRLARSQLAQAQTDMERSRKAVESVAALLPGLAVKLPGGLDLKQSVTEANQAIQAWADALAAASQSDAPLTEDQLKLLKTQQEAAEKAKKALTESFDKVVATATKHLNTAFETAMNAGEAALITTVTVATGGVATMPVGLLLSVVKPAVKKLVGLWIDRALRDEQHIRRADIAPAIVEVIKENVNEGWKKTLEASPIVGILAEGIAQIVAINLPFIDGGVEEAADKKISGQIEGQTNKLETFDDALVNQAGSLLNRENRRRGPAEAGGDVYGDSVSREQERAALRQGVRQRLEERAKQRGLRANDPVVTQTAAALQSTLGDGDVSRLQALVTEHGVEKMQGLLHNVVRPEDDAKLEDRISGPLRRFLQDLAAGGPGNQSPGAVGGLSAATPDNSADDGSQSAQNNTRSNATPDATSAPAPERMETLESSSGRSLRGGNVAGVSDRAAARLSSMSPEQAAEVQAILHDSGVSPSARALLERGLAAGYGLSELRLLRDLTVNRSDAELLAEFTGLGLSQIGQVSCLPTAYQIAIAEQDPLYAYRLRQNPDAMSTQDGGGGVVFTQAELEQLRTLRVQNAETSLASMPLELAKIVLPALQAKGIDPTSREALNEVDRILSSLGAPVQSGTQGLDVTQFTQNAALHKTLEARVGRELSLVPMNLQDVQAALAQGHPVPVLTAAESLMGDRRVADAHAQVILSFDGQRYTVHDPQGGGVRQLTAAELQRELGARWALLPTGAAVAPQATTSGGVTTPAPRGGDDRQRRLDAAQAVKTVLDDATVASIAAEVGEGDKGGDAPLNRLRAAIDARLATLRAQTQAAGEYASWLTTEFVLDLIAQDVALKRGLQKGLIGTDTNRAQVLESIKPAHRLAAKINAASDDRARLAAVAETVGRVGAEVKLLDGVAGAELLDALSKFERDEDRMVAQEMLQTGRVLSWLGSGANRALMIEDRGLDGVRAPLTERASLLTELGVLANSIDTKKPEDAKERLEGLRARVTQTLGRLRALKAESQDAGLPADRRDAAKAELARLEAEVKAIVQGPLRSGGVLAALSAHDPSWTTDSLVPLLTEAQGGPVTLSPDLAARQAALPLWRNNSLELAALKSMSVRRRKAFFERIVQDAKTYGGDAKANLAEVARRYAEEHGSLSAVIQDTYGRQGQDLSGRTPVADMGGLRATLDAFGFETSAVGDGIEATTGSHDQARRAQAVEAVHDAAATILKSVTSALVADRVKGVEDALRKLATQLGWIYGVALADPAAQAALAKLSAQVALGETHGELLGVIAQSSMARQGGAVFDGVIRALGIDPATIQPLVEEAKALKGGEETLTEHMGQNPALEGQRLPPAERIALVEGAKELPDLLDTLLRMTAEQRALVRGDPLLMATLARTQPEAWPFLKTVLNGELSPVAMLRVMELLRYSVASGLDMKEMGIAVLKLGKDAMLGQIGALIKDGMETAKGLGDTVIKSVGGDLIKARTQRMQEDMTELLKDYVAWRDQQLRAQNAENDDRDRLDESRALEAQRLLADPEFTRFLQERFSKEQQAAILSTLMHGEVDASDTIRVDRLNPLTQEKRVLDPLREAWDDKEGEEGEKIGELRADPGVMGRLSRVGEGRRVAALGMLLNTPLGKVLAEARTRRDVSGKNQWTIVNELAALSQADRDALRDDPATVEYLASLVTDGDAKRSLQALLAVDENNLGDEIYAPGATEQDKQRAWLRTASVAGLTAMMKHGDEKMLLGLAAKLYRAQVPDPNQTPGFEERVALGVRAGDLSAQDRGAIADALRATEDYQRLLKTRPGVAAAVIDAVLGEVDPSVMLYERNVKREFLDASADDLVEILQNMSVESFLSTMVNMDGFGAAYQALQSARQAQANLSPNATPDEQTAAADAVRAAERAAREYAFDMRADRIAELKDLSNEDKDKVLTAARKRVELLLTGQQEVARGEIARAVSSSMTQAGAATGVTLTEDEVKALFDRERGARNELAQAEQRLTEDKRIVKLMEAFLGRVPLPGFDVKGEIEEYEEAVSAWRDALKGMDAAGGPSREDLETLTSLKSKVDNARDALMETHGKVIDAAKEFIKPLIEETVGNIPLVELLGPVVEAFATTYAERLLSGESLARKADISRVVREYVKGVIGDEFDGLLEDNKILEGLDGLIDKVVGADIPLLNDLFEGLVDEKVQGQLDGLKEKVSDLDDTLAELGEDQLNDGLRRVGAKGRGEDRYAASIQREKDHAAMFTTVSNALDARAAAMGAQIKSSDVSAVQAALRAALGGGDVAKLRSLTASLGVDVMSQLLFSPARPEDDVLRDETLARLSPAVRDPIVAWRDALRSGGPGAVGGLGEDSLQSAADDADQALQAALGDPDDAHRPHRGSSAEWCYARLQRLWRARLVSLGLAKDEEPLAEAVRAGLEEAILTGRPARLRAAMRDAGPVLARRLAGEVLPGTPVPKEHSAAIQAAVEDASRGVER